MPATWVTLHSFPLPPCRAQELYQQLGQTSAYHGINIKHQPRPSWLTSYLCTYLGLALSAVHVHTASLISITGLYGLVWASSKMLPIQEHTPEAKACIDAFGLVSSHQPGPLGSSLASSHSCWWAWLKPWLLSLACTSGLSCSKFLHCISSWPWFNSLHCPPLLCMHSWGDITARKLHTDGRTPQLPMHPQLAHILDDSPGPHH